MGNALKLEEKILYKDLSYEIVGSAFIVFNELGPGHLEKVYEKALAKEFEKRKIKFLRQVYFPVKFNNAIVGENRFDFLVEDKIIVELKTGSYFPRGNIEQVNKYLAAKNLKLAILLNFTKDDVKQKRVINLNDTKIDPKNL